MFSIYFGEDYISQWYEPQGTLMGSHLNKSPEPTVNCKYLISFQYIIQDVQQNSLRFSFRNFSAHKALTDDVFEQPLLSAV